MSCLIIGVHRNTGSKCTDPVKCVYIEPISESIKLLPHLIISCSAASNRINVGGRFYLNEEYGTLIVFDDKDGRKVNVLRTLSLRDDHEMSWAGEQLNQKGSERAIVLVLIDVTLGNRSKLFKDVWCPGHRGQN